MATFTHFQPFVENLAEGVFNLSNTLTIALTLTAPEATMGILSQLSQISYTNLSSRLLPPSTSLQTSGTYKLINTTNTMTATGTVGAFRYIVLYDDYAVNDELVGYYDYGSSLTLADGDAFAVNLSEDSGLLTIAPA